MTDLQIWKWLRWNAFYHATNVYRCRGLSYSAANDRLKRALGPSFDHRQSAVEARLAANRPQDENNALLAFGYKITPTYCRRIRYVVSDMLRGTSELERRLGIR
jgi:hypothetical protein